MHLVPRLATLGAVAMAALALTSGPARARGGFLPPMKVDLGEETLTEHGGVVRGGGVFMLGLHLATVWPRPLPFDVGIGFIDVDLGDPQVTIAARSVDPSGGAGGGTASAPPTAMPGWFLETSALLGGGEHWRTWLSMRGEQFPDTDRNEYGGVVRVSGELWTGVAAGGGNAAIFGVLSLGVWAEAGVRELPDGETARVAATGLSFRLPLLVAS